MSISHSRRDFGKWLCVQATVASALPIAGSAASPHSPTDRAPLSRAAFIATIADHFGWVHSSDYHDAYKNPQPTFADVRIGETPWARQVEAALEAGLIDNHRGVLEPGQPVSRSEAAALYARAFGVDNAVTTRLLREVAGAARDEAPLSGADSAKLLARLAATVVAPPQVLCKSGTTAPRRYVQLMTPTPGATLRYTLTSDGSEPADPLSAAGKGYDLREDGVLQLTNPLDSTTDYRLYRLKAVAVKEGLGSSAVREYAWNIVRPRSGDFQARLVQLGTTTSPTIWRIFNPAEYYQANVYYIEGTQRGLCFDAGEYAHDKRNLKVFLDTIARKPYDLVVGHNHPDHAEQVHNFTSAGIRLHVSAQEKASFMASPRADYRAAGEAAIAIGEGHVFDLGNVQVTAFPIPGHTHGLTTILVNQTGQVFGSDMWGCNRPHTADTTQYQGVKVDLFLSLVLQLIEGYRKASASGEIMQVTNAHQEQPVGQRCVENFVRCFQQLVDEGNEIAQPSIRGGLKGGDRMSLVGDMWRDKDWMAIGPIGKFAAPVDYFTRPTQAHPCGATIDYNAPGAFRKYSQLALVGFEGATLKGVDVHWAAAANGVANKLPGKFDPWTYEYEVALEPGRKQVAVRPRALSSRCRSLTVNGRTLRAGEAARVDARPGGRIDIEVLSPDGSTSSRYRFTMV